MTQKIDSKDLDVIVIGAGPAGGSTARELAKLGRKVLLIERSQEIGEPNYSTAGTPKETVEEFSLPESVLSAEWNKISIATPRARAVWEYPNPRGYVFDFAALRKFLAEDAANSGAEILVGTSVEDFVREGGEVVGVRYHGALGSGEVKAKVIVDATGHNEFGNSKLKLNSEKIEDLGTAMEYVMTGLPPELQGTLGLYMGPDYIAEKVYGYAWAFPMKGNSDAKVGICALGKLPDGLKLDELQEKFIDGMPEFKKMEPTEIHAGAARLYRPNNRHAHRNVLLVGDSSRQVNPLGGEGIRHSLRAGRMAAGVIDEYLKGNKANPAWLEKEFEKRWRKQFARQWKLSRLFINRAARLSAKDWDKLINVMKHLSPDELFDFMFNYNFLIILKIAGFGIPNMIKSLVSRR